ncbi:MAG: LacI family transcriptional regulator, partial [Paenibacillaceae bacterium]|nr:LacI family transcriptional regulator [Paenibacillaceae bacterium]
MSVTIKDIARLAGVSYSTVSKALNNSPLVRTEKKQRIRELAKQLGYQPNMVAKSLVSKRSMSIGIVLPSFDSSATGVLLEQVHNELLRRRYDVVLSMLPTEAAIDFFLRQRVDGIIAFEDLRPTTVANRMTTELPMVSIGSAPVFSSRYALVDTKRKDAIRQAVRYLHGRGH